MIMINIILRDIAININGDPCRTLGRLPSGAVPTPGSPTVREGVIPEEHYLSAAGRVYDFIM